MKNYVFIVLITIVSSCSSGVVEIEQPKDLIGKEKMVEVMLELVKLEAHIQSTYPSVSEYNKVMINSSDTLFKRLNITSKKFEESMDYYGSHQKIMKEIYEEVLDELNSELGELQSNQKKN